MTVVPMPREELDPDSFEAFWRHYPRKVDKALARAKWTAITTTGLRTRTLDRDSNTYVEMELRATPAELLAGAKRYSEEMFDRSTYRFKDDGKFICHASTWLNRGRWQDHE